MINLELLKVYVIYLTKTSSCINSENWEPVYKLTFVVFLWEKMLLCNYLSNLLLLSMGTQNPHFVVIFVESYS